jgi:hypothetical protein
MQKQVWRKQEKELYLPKPVPSLVTIPKMKYFTISGVGNPNDKEFSDKVGVLYYLSYGIKTLPKYTTPPKDYYDYTVYPLEGIWSGDPTNKDSFKYKIMIRQPDFVTNEIFSEVIAMKKKQKPDIYIDNVLFETITDGKCVQMLHMGSYDSEPVTFEQMDQFLEDNDLLRKGNNHREIYLSNPDRVEPDKLKTVLRYFVE